MTENDLRNEWLALSSQWLTGTVAMLHADARRRGHDQPGVLLVRVPTEKLRRSMAGEHLTVTTAWQSAEAFADQVAAHAVEVGGDGPTARATMIALLQSLDMTREVAVHLESAPKGEAPRFARLQIRPVVVEAVH